MAKKSKKRAKKSDGYSIPDMLGTGGTYIYLTAMMIVYPVFYRENLLNLITDKKIFFLVFSFIYLFCLLPAAVVWMIKFFTAGEKKKLRPDTLSAIVLLAAVGISAINAVDRKEALIGISYRTVAADVFVLCIFSYFAVRAYGKYNNFVVISWLAGSALIYLSGILCGCKINFLHMQDKLAVPENFLTPLGNTNFNACYVSLVLPTALVVYMICRQSRTKIIDGVVMYMGFLFAIFIKTESSVLAVFAVLVILLAFAVEREAWFARYLEMLGIYVLAWTTVFLLRSFMGKYLYAFDGLDAFLLKGGTVFAEWVLFFAVLLLYKWKGDRLREGLLRIRKGALCAAAAAAVLVLLAAVLVNTVFRNGAKESVLRFLLLTDESFSKRGIIWRNTAELLGRSSVLQLLFGHGLNSFGTSVKAFCYEELMDCFGFLIKDPHNEFLQVLTDMGIVGVVGYFGLLLTTLRNALRGWKNNEWLIAAALTVCGYLIQGLVNCYALTHLPLLFLFLGLVNGDMLQNKSGDF